MSGVVACVLTVSQGPWFRARIDDRVGLWGVNWVAGGEEVRVAFRGRHQHALRGHLAQATSDLRNGGPSPFLDSS